jgi:hypothetical protein
VGWGTKSPTPTPGAEVSVGATRSWRGGGGAEGMVGAHSTYRIRRRLQPYMAEGMVGAHSTYRIRRAASAPKVPFWLLQCEHQYAPYLRGVAGCGVVA